MVFVHLLDASGKLADQVDELPFQEMWPTSTWRAGDRLPDRHILYLAPELPEGDYTISVGLYSPDTLERIPARSRQNLVTDDAVSLTRVSICSECPAEE